MPPELTSPSPFANLNRRQLRFFAMEHHGSES